jgi:hypothetical protein
MRAAGRLRRRPRRAFLLPYWQGMQAGGGLVTGIDGMRFVVPVRSIHARPNPKYFGRRRGATWLNMLND